MGEPLAAGSATMRGHSLRRISEDAQGLLSYHPIVADGMVLVNNQTKIFAFDAKTGEPAWPVADPKHERGEIFEGENASMGSGRFAGGLGVSRFTMTAHDGRLYARMGSQITTRPMELADSRTSGYLVCLDLRAQGKVVWTIPGADQRGAPDEEKWAFEGSPLAAGSDVYIAMRKSDVRPQVHVACFDAETGRRRWRTMICAAETPGGGQAEEITHNLLTLHDGVIYCNTNLGAVGAVAAADGRLLWASVYPRAQKASPDGHDKRTAHFYRDLNPCIYYRGLLLVAPTDCESIFALDANSGALAWESHLPEDAVHLLGVGHGNLLASGDSLWWIDADGGKVVKHWPSTSPSGYGRGALVGDVVLWPTRDELYVFDQAVLPRQTIERDPIPLAEGRGAGGGNVVVAGDLVLIATADKLFAFERSARADDAPQHKTAAAVTGVNKKVGSPP